MNETMMPLVLTMKEAMTAHATPVTLVIAENVLTLMSVTSLEHVMPTCGCSDGYNLNVTILPGGVISIRCSDADECALHSDNGDRDHGFCSNTVGG